MKKTLLVIAVLGAFALSACSSDKDPDATPEGDDTSPEVTETAPNAEPSVTPNDPPVGGSDIEFCRLLEDSTALGDEVDATNQALTAAMNDTENFDSPETLATLHVEGAAMVDQANDAADLFNEAARNVDDPEVAAGLKAMADFFLEYYLPMGAAAADADSMMDFALTIGSTFDYEAMDVMMEELMDASMVVGDYTYEVCGSYL